MASKKSSKKPAPAPEPAPAKSKTGPKSSSAKTPAAKKTTAAAAPPEPVKSVAKPATKKAAEPKSPTKTAAAVKVKAADTVPASIPETVAADKWTEIRSLLLSMKQQTLQEIKRSIKSGSEATIGEEPTGDIYDQASSERDRELGLLLNDREREKLHNIDEALLRIAEGDYGICEECDEDIPMGRLKVLPFTRHCVRCKSDIEKFQAQTRRIEEDRAYREIPVGDEDEG